MLGAFFLAFPPIRLRWRMLSNPPLSPAGVRTALPASIPGIFLEPFTTS
ncbi:hypothetical protein D556_3266 [Bordetella holmesii 41130]|nr:hypothetical protein D558_3268 [Bordetella holmesii 44057]EWM43128.1 hypothetical protein D556_3266 [Bordetella holmesii 41130]